MYKKIDKKLIPGQLLYGKFQDYINSETIVTISTIIELINKKGSYPYYFREYVLHDEKHIQRVLDYVEKLIPDETLNHIFKLNSDAIDVLILAVCIHDIAMFIDENGFETLLEDEKWKIKFDDFIVFIEKADDKTLDKIYGSMNSAFDENQNKKILHRRNNMLCKENIYTVGEFIRKHHHEIAYDIALNGFPYKGRRETLINNSKYKNLIGLVAKSHRGNIREIVKEAENDQILFAEQGYTPFDIPIIYLMCVLWIADEIDDKADYRSPINDMLDKDLTTFSEQQWHDNICVIDTTFNNDKPIVFFHATPKNTNQFLRLQSHCKKVQSAIDQSITAIVEYYGQRSTMFFLSVLRVKSSLDESHNNEFLPVDASLRINPEIINLLIGPLYGNDESFAVRELLSNALDACHEREVVDTSYHKKAKIECSVSLDYKYFKIIDNGIGMTSDTIVNYFMTVGASLRNSSEWKTQFIKKNDDLSSPRLGRFGIGVLSAFLLGDKIEVTTRHYNSSKGYSFSFTKEIDIPNIWIVDCEVGTEIKIHMSSSSSYMDYRMFFQYDNKNSDEYFVPHYPFMYPMCIYFIEYWKCHSQSIFYYNEQNYLRKFDCNNITITIGSKLDAYNLSIKGEDRIFERPFISKYEKSHNKETVKHDFISIEDVYYNGMLIKIYDVTNCFRDLYKLGLTTKPLYIKIDDYSDSATVNLNKTLLYNGSALEKLQEISSFFLMMLPLIVKTKYIYKALRMYPIDDVILREISYQDFNQKDDDDDSVTLLYGAYLNVPWKIPPGFAFEYAPDYCISEKGLCGCMSKSIIEWLVVSEGYQQDYKIPLEIEERRKKYKKAFDELDKYLTFPKD